MRCHRATALHRAGRQKLPVVILVLLTVEEQLQTNAPGDDEAPDEEVGYVRIERESRCGSDAYERKAGPFSRSFVNEFSVEQVVGGAGEEDSEDEEHRV